MTEVNDRLEIYRENFEKLNLKYEDLAYLFNLGEEPSKTTISRIRDKLRGDERKGISKSEALAKQLLMLLKKQKIDLSSIKFDEDGKLISASYKNGEEILL